MADERSTKNHSKESADALSVGSETHRNEAKLHSKSHKKKFTRTQHLWQKFRGLQTDRQIELWFTGIVALTTLIYSLFSIGLWIETRHLANGSDIAQRAWVGVGNITISPSRLEVGKSARIVVTFKNTGQTPALGMT